MSVREQIMRDLANMSRANKELSANLNSIKQLMDANAALSTEAHQKTQLMFDKITAKQSIFHGGNLRNISTSLATK